MNHLPECPKGIDVAAVAMPCICDRLRACEARVLDTIRRDSWYEDGYAAALTAARDVVAALDWFSLSVPMDDALAAIDALRGES